MQGQNCKQIEKITSMEAEIKHHAITLEEIKSIVDKLNNNLQRILFAIIACLVSFISAILAYIIKVP